VTQPPQPAHPQSPHGQTASVTAATVRLSVTGTHIVIAWFLTAATFGYLLPWAVAATRRKSNAKAIGVLTALTGWTGVGWFVALVMACWAEPAPVTVYYARPAYAPTPVPALAAPQGWYPDAAGQLQYWDGRAWAPPPPG
jgi:Superinfection immunity protein